MIILISFSLINLIELYSTITNTVEVLKIITYIDKSYKVIREGLYIVYPYLCGKHYRIVILSGAKAKSKYLLEYTRLCVITVAIDLSTAFTSLRAVNAVQDDVASSIQIRVEVYYLNTIQIITLFHILHLLKITRSHTCNFFKLTT